MRNNLPIIGVNEPTTAGMPIIRIEVRMTEDKQFQTDVWLVNNKGGGQGWDKMLLKPETTPDCALLAGHLAIIRKLSSPQ